MRLWLGDAVLTIAPLWTLLLQHVLVKRDGIEQFLTQAKGVKPKWMDVRTHQLATLVLFAASADSRGCFHASWRANKRTFCLAGCSG